MKIISDKSNFQRDKNTVVTVGTFDGVHKGHLNILELVVKKAKSLGGKSVLITFDPHPRTVVSKEYKIDLLTTLDEKVRLLERIGFDYVLVIRFTKEFSQLTYEEFIKKYVYDKTGAENIVIGHDHRFGKDRGGDENKLRSLGKEMNFNVVIVGAVKIDDETVSSTKIRNALNEGNIAKANSYLGWNYMLSGKVVEGAKRGRTLGYPTANILLDDENKLVPKFGVYAVKCSLEGREVYGVMNIGVRPTFSDIKDRIIEIHLFDFDGDIYEKNLNIEFIERIRGEIKFENKDELIKQISLDIKKAKKVLTN